MFAPARWLCLQGVGADSSPYADKAVWRRRLRVLTEVLLKGMCLSAENVNLPGWIRCFVAGCYFV